MLFITLQIILQTRRVFSNDRFLNISINGESLSRHARRRRGRRYKYLRRPASTPRLMEGIQTRPVIACHRRAPADESIGAAFLSRAVDAALSLLFNSDTELLCAIVRTQ